MGDLLVDDVTGAGLLSIFAVLDGPAGNDRTGGASGATGNSAIFLAETGDREDHVLVFTKQRRKLVCLQAAPRMSSPAYT